MKMRTRRTSFLFLSKLLFEFVASAFFIGELGDKTQLTAMTLGAKSAYPFLTLLELLRECISP